MRIRTDRRAADDLIEASRWYRDRGTLLERRLRREYTGARSRIRAHPYAGQPTETGARRVFLPHFPYAVVYEVQEREVVIIAFAHLKRSEYWRER